MANGIEVAKAYVTIVPSLQGSQSTITSELTGITSSASETAGEESGRQFGESLATGLKTTATVIAGAVTAVTASVIATGKAFIDATNDVAEYGDTVDKESQKMHISAEAYQEWDFILQHAGSSVDGMKTAMKTLTSEAESGSEAFEALGISTEDIANMSQEELFGAVITGLQGVEDEAERTTLAQELLGRSSVEMTALFNMSAEETEALREQVHELGGVMSDEAVQASADYADAMTNLETSFSGLKKNLMSQFLPSITETMEGLAKVFSGDDSGIGQIREGITSLIEDLTAIAPEFFTLAQTLVFALLEGFAPMLPSLVETLFNIVIQAITLLTGMLPSIMPSIIAGLQGIFQSLFEALPVITSALFELVMTLINWLAEGDNIHNFINGIIQVVSLIVKQFSQILPVLLPAIIKIVGEIVTCLTEPDTILMLVGAVLELVGAIFVALVECVPEFIDFVVNLVTTLSEYVVSFLDWIVPIVSQGVTKLLETVKTWGSNIWNFILSIGSNIRNGVINWINNVRSTIIGWIDGIRSAFENWLNNLKNGFQNAFDNIRDKISSIVDKAKNLVSNIISEISELPEKVISIGKNLVEGLWNGINDKISWVKNKIWSMGSAITNAIKGVFGIASPSKVFAEIGDYLAQGLGVGFDDGMDDVQKDMLNATEGLTASMTADVSAYASGASALTGSETNNYNGGSIVMNIYGAEGQNVNELAELIAVRLDDMTRRKGSVYA